MTNLLANEVNETIGSSTMGTMFLIDWQGTRQWERTIEGNYCSRDRRYGLARLISVFQPAPDMVSASIQLFSKRMPDITMTLTLDLDKWQHMPTVEDFSQGGAGYRMISNMGDQEDFHIPLPHIFFMNSQEIGALAKIPQSLIIMPITP